jgi:hypothetical protein
MEPEKRENRRATGIQLARRPLSAGLTLIADALAVSIRDGLGAPQSADVEIQRGLRTVMMHAHVLTMSHVITFLRGRAQFDAAALLETEFKPWAK